MDNIKEFTEELTSLCNKYGYFVTGKTTSGSLHIAKVDSEIECHVERADENMSFVRCSCR